MGGRVADARAVRFVQDGPAAVRTVVVMTPRFDVIGLVVAGMAASLAFCRALGLDVPPAADSEPHVEHTLPGGLRLATVATIRSFDPAWTEPSGGPGVGLAFLCDSPAEVDRVYAELVSAAADGHLPPWDAEWGQRYASLRDPGGNGVDLFAPL